MRCLRVNRNWSIYSLDQKMKYPFCLVTVILFLPFVQHLPMTVKVAYIFVSYIVYGIFLSTINIPYGAMAAAISSNPNDRTSLSTFRSIGSAIGGSTTGFFIPILMYTHNKSGQQVVSGIISFGFPSDVRQLHLSHTC